MEFKEFVDCSDDIAILKYTPEELADYVMAQNEHVDFYNSAQRIADKIRAMHNNSASNRFKQRLNDSCIVHGLLPVVWDEIR